MDVSAWIGPVIIAAIISFAGGVLTVFLTHRQAIRLDVRRRLERVRDVQTALRAEIRSSWYRLAAVNSEEHLARVVAKISEIGGDGYTPFVPRESNPVVFNAIVKDIQILPTDVIDAVVLYYDHMHLMANFVEDLGSDRFRQLEPDRKIEMYRDYVGMLGQAEAFASQAIEAINDAMARHAT